MDLCVNIFLIAFTGGISLFLIVFGCVILFSDREYIGLVSIIAGLLYALIPIILIYDMTKPVEKQLAEKQQAVIEAQKELEKFFIDHPELKGE